jgi:integrase/recombinase XerD
MVKESRGVLLDNKIAISIPNSTPSAPVGMDKQVFFIQSTGDLIMTTLREKMKEAMILRGFSEGTQRKYLYEVIKLYKYYQQSPAKLSQEEIKSYLLYLISERKLAASTYNVAVHSLRFFYDMVLRRVISYHDFPLSKEPRKLPDILSVKEVADIIKAAVNIKHRTMLVLAYGAGLRSAEVANLTVGDIDSDRMQIHIRNGKGGKDRYVVLSPVMLEMLRNYWRKYRIQVKSIWIFPGQSSAKPITSSTVGAVYKQAKERAGINKKGGVHSLRHAFATHSLEAGEDLYTIKQLLGHSCIESTACYLRLTNNKMKLIKSPIEALDI